MSSGPEDFCLATFHMTGGLLGCLGLVLLPRQPHCLPSRCPRTYNCLNSELCPSLL